MYTNLQRPSCLHQRLVSLALFRCYGGSYLFDRYLSLHTRNLNSICRVVILAQTLFLLCSRRAVELPHRLHSPRPKPQRGHLILQLDGREVEIHCRPPDHAHFFSFSCFLRADQGAISRFAAFLLRIKAFALQKRPLSVLFTLAGRTAAILDVAINVKTRKSPEWLFLSILIISYWRSKTDNITESDYSEG